MLVRRDAVCPVGLVAQGIIALEPDDEKVAAYLRRYCQDAEDIPLGLRDGL